MHKFLSSLLYYTILRRAERGRFTHSHRRRKMENSVLSTCQVLVVFRAVNFCFLNHASHNEVLFVINRIPARCKCTCGRHVGRLWYGDLVVGPDKILMNFRADPSTQYSFDVSSVSMTPCKFLIFPSRQFSSYISS